MNDPVMQYFLYPSQGAPAFEIAPMLSPDRGYFQFGPGLVCYGKTSAGYRCGTTDEPLYDTADDVVFTERGIELPFDPGGVVTNLAQELYLDHSASPGKLLRQVYYSLRPMLPTVLRSALQRRYFEGRQQASFPAWPVDTTVDQLMNKLLLLGLKSKGLSALPFIWFWPDGASACSIMTHDVETKAGQEFCSKLMDVDEEFGIAASFQIIPERRYGITHRFVDSLKRRGFEVNLQDLNHDGRLYSSGFEEFSRRIDRINSYAREFETAGFRSAILYRRQEWFHLFDFAYDMSVPNTARYDPQRGGCCTVMPYFIGSILELPLTTSQDYTVFHYLKSYSLDLWREQIRSILSKHGLISFIFHPDYLIDRRALDIYKELLRELGKLRSTKTLWIARPGEVNRWWRNRAAMRLSFKSGEWVIEGPDRERARVAFAFLEDDRIVYTLPDLSSSLVS